MPFPIKLKDSPYLQTNGFLTAVLLGVCDRRLRRLILFIEPIDTHVQNYNFI